MVAHASRAQALAGDDSSGSSAPSIMAPTDTLLPRVGIDTTQPGFADTLRDTFDSQSGPGPRATVAGPGFQIQSRIMVSEEWTQHADEVSGGAGGAHGNGSDFVTLIQPDILVSESTERVNGVLHYAPTGEIFARSGGNDEVRQGADGSLQVTALPGWFYIDTRGSIAEQSVFGGLGQQSNAPLTSNNRDLTYSFSATPYVARTLGNLGTMQVGASYIYSAVNAPNSFQGTTYNALGFAVPENYGSSSLGTRREFANFTTGSFVERLQDEISLDASQYSGTGELTGAHRLLLADNASYAINRFVAVVGQFGYENVNYPQALFRYDGGIYAAGFTLTPGKNANLTLEYRHTDGFGALFGHGTWHVTPRISINGTYSEGISSFNQDQQNSLLYGNVDATGAYASALLAAPLIPTSDLSPNVQSLQHQRQLNIAAVWIANRDIFTLQYNQSRSNVVGTPLGLPLSILQRIDATGLSLAELLALAPSYLAYIGVTPALLRQSEQYTNANSETFNGLLSWHRDLQPSLASNVSIGYAYTTAAFTNIGNPGSLQIGASLTKTLTDKISVSASYGGNFLISGATANNAYSDNNTFTVSVVKRF